ncbi:MAG TPA: FHA domain-containing protein [Polyangiaceae bacterium]|nr:FHA domain-containing protein [Polyangiaceae bacterium]
MWKLTIEDDQTNKTVVHLVRDEYGLGRAEENAIRLTERNISRLHAQLERKNEHWALRDLSSYNGCYVNGQRVAGAQELNHGDVIQVGDYRLALENEALLVNEQDATATVPAPRTAAPSSSVDRLVMLMGPSPGAEFELTQQRMVIGRGEDCDVALNHASVSRIHAEMHPLGDGRYEIVDRQSANGVRVNGVELPRSFIDARDVIELGDVILKFIPAGQMYTPGADESLQIAAIGAARRQEAEESGIEAFGRTSNAKWFVGLGVLFLVAVAAAVVITQRSTPAEMVSMKDAATARAEQTLSAAKQLLAQGDPTGAYAKSSEVPQGSALRETSDFRQIQAAYADYLFTQADQASDAADKRALYDQIARAPTIDRGRRNRAAEQLAALSAKAVNVKDLPNARPPAPPLDEAQRARTTPAPSASEEAPEVPEPPPAAAPPPRTPTPRGERSTPPPATSKGQATTLVRESPF